MGCNCINKKRQDFIYIKKLAYAFGQSLKADVQIYAFYIGLTKYYDFDELPTRQKRSEIVEIIQFQQPQSNNILQDIGRSESKLTDSERQEKTTVTRRVRKVKPTVDHDTGEVLPDN